MPTNVVATDEFVEWYDDLDDRRRKSVMRAVDLLEQVGTALRHRFYLAMVPFAEAIWEQYQAEREKEKKP